MSTAPSQTAAANQARRKRTEDKLRAVADAIQQMQRRRLPVTYPAIASRAGVSRTFLYDNPAARDLISAAIARTATRREHDHYALQRLTAENTTLKQRLRQLTSDQRAMEEKLQAARSNNRFLDKRIAGLEAQLLDAGISGRT